MKQYATYLRVSTQKQGHTQLGLSSQRSMCEGFIKEHNGELGKEFLDIESGTHRDRKGLWNAIEFCNNNHCPLVIATLSRLARDVEFCFKVINTGIEIHFVDMPTINTLLLGVFASVAQYERELTSDRTKKALAVKKAQGAKLGASNEKYRLNYEMKSETIKREEGMKKGIIRNRHKYEGRDTQTMIRILRRVFPDYTKGEPNTWRWTMIGTRDGACDAIYNAMEDYKAMDDTGTLFSGWDFAAQIDKRKRQTKLAAYMQAIKKSADFFFNNLNTED